VTTGIPVVINAGAGSAGAADLANTIAQSFLAHGARADLRSASTGSELVAMIRAAVSEHPRAIVAGGGDGTISSAAALLAGTDISLGVLPLGTLNHFAKDLRIPLAIDKAVQCIVGGNTMLVDVGEVNDRVFINNSSLGLYPDMVRDRERQQRRLGRGKWWAMLWASLATLRRSPFLWLTLEIEGRDAVHYRSPFVFVGNNDYVMEGFDIGARESLRGGRLSIYTTTRRTRLGLVALALRAVLGRLRQARDFSTAAACRVRIDSPHRRLLVATDGEVTAMETPLEFRVLPAALPVLAPSG